MKGFLFIFFLFFLSGCDLPHKGLIEASAPPFISRATISPNLIDVNGLASQPKDPIDTVVQFVVSASNVDRTTQVSFSLLDPDGTPLLTGAMLDNGVSPDQAAGDGIFSAAIHLHILKEDVGVYGMQFQASGSTGDRSNTVLASLLVWNDNDHPPQISSLSMQDTAAVPPPGETTFVRITLAVSDSEGPGDIASVTLSSQKPNGTSAGVFYLYDDGGAMPLPQFGLPSGDSAANNGIYTITIPLTKAPPAPETLPTYRDFSFVASDRSGKVSNTIVKRIFLVQ